MKFKEVAPGSKIVYAYGANSIDTKNIGMVGFTFYNEIKVELLTPGGQPRSEMKSKRIVVKKGSSQIGK